MNARRVRAGETGPAASAPGTAPDDATCEAAVAEVVVPNPQGLHLRPATEFAKIALASGCRVRVEADTAHADGASVLELAMLGVVQGTRLRISAQGEGASMVVDSLAALVERGFHEH